jgi:hypothetical protein
MLEVCSGQVSENGDEPQCLTDRGPQPGKNKLTDLGRAFARTLEGKMDFGVARRPNDRSRNLNKRVKSVGTESLKSASNSVVRSPDTHTNPTPGGRSRSTDDAPARVPMFIVRKGTPSDPQLETRRVMPAKQQISDTARCFSIVDAAQCPTRRSCAI